MGFRPHCVDINENLLIAGTTDGYINIWDLRKFYKHLDAVRGHEECIESIVFRDELNFYTGSRDTSVKSWEIKKYLINKCEYIFDDDEDEK